MPVSANSLQGMLAVFAQDSLEQFVANMPKYSLFTTDFSATISNGGISFTTRVPTTVYSTANDLTNGWASTAASSSAVTGTLKIRDFDHVFNELEWNTMTPQVLQNTYFKQMGKQLANSIIVDALNNVTSSVYTNTITVNSSSNFTLTGSNSLQAGATLLDNLEVDTQDRYALITPNIYQALAGQVTQTYIYGDSSVVKNYAMPNIAGFDTVKYPRFINATKPAGGDSYGNSDKLVGVLGNKAGLVAAVRAPLEVNTDLVASSTVVDPTSGLSLQLRIINDISKPGYRIAVVSIFGTAAGNTKAIVPVLTQSV